MWCIWREKFLVIFYFTTPNTNLQSLLVFVILPRCCVSDASRTFKRCCLAFIWLFDTSNSCVQSSHACTVGTQEWWFRVVELKIAKFLPVFFLIEFEWSNQVGCVNVTLYCMLFGCLLTPINFWNLRWRVGIIFCCNVLNCLVLYCIILHCIVCFANSGVTFMLNHWFSSC